jgi:hypothetical protein
MSTESVDESVAIRDRMQRLRNRIDHRAVQLSASTQEMFDWKTYARRFPIGIVAAGLVLGFLVAPSRKVSPTKRSASDSLDPSPQSSQDVNAFRQPAKTEGRKKRPGIVNSTILPWVRQFAWSYLKGLAAVQFETFVRDLQAARSGASTVRNTAEKDRSHATSLPESKRRGL